MWVDMVDPIKQAKPMMNTSWWGFNVWIQKPPLPAIYNTIPSIRVFMEHYTCH
uniref:Uncharacterized protein n=1 Tax=Arion vulgaris TaxID=1028688 RepID=A0A0B6YR89_9EUPU